MQKEAVQLDIFIEPKSFKLKRLRFYKWLTLKLLAAVNKLHNMELAEIKRVLEKHDRTNIP